MLVVVLGLLVALFVIGTSFSFITLSERRAAANALERQRALDLALDGVEYSIARLRAEATVQHYEGIGPSVPGLDASGKEHDPRRYTLHPIDSSDPALSWPRSKSITSPTTSVDANWIDFNGDNSRGGNESGYGSDLVSTGQMDRTTGFHADGINTSQLRNEKVARAGDTNYGPSGTHMELGDTFMVRAVDAASLLNLNNFKGPALERTLLILGDAIDAWLNKGKPGGKDNPFPPEVVVEFMRFADDAGFIFNTKDELRPIWNVVDDADRLYEIAMNFVTIESWRDPYYRDWVDANNKIDEDKLANPLGLTDQQFWREGFSHSDQNGRDGWPDWQPTAASGYLKAPVNVNTATKPVLICLFAGLEAKARLLFYQKQNLISDNDKLIKDTHNEDVPSQSSGTPDIGRQNNRNDVSGTGITGEVNWYPSGHTNRAIFQLVPIGPIETTFGSRGQTAATIGAGGAGGSVDHASALADEVIRLRGQHPFTSWQDFESRFLRGILLGINDNARDNVRVPDLIGVVRGDLQRNPQAVEGAFAGVRKMLPDPTNCEHRANPLKTSDSAMQSSDFRAWYWKSCVDMIRAALCPSNLSSRYNSDYPLHSNVDRMDLVSTTAPICFSSMGRYELVSVGQILAPIPQGSNKTTASTSSGEQMLIARRKVRTTVEIYSIMRHTTQRHFTTPVTLDSIDPTATSSQPTKIEALTSKVKQNTRSGPFSMNELDQGIWENNSGAESTWLNNLDDGKGIGYTTPEQGKPSPNKDRVGGHNDHSQASNDFGWVTMEPRDETPFDDLRETGSYPLAFHARFNESLRARSRSLAFPNLRIEGNSSDSPAIAGAWGHLPWETDAMFEDFISSATPRSTEASLAGSGAKIEFANAASGDEATIYSNLMPDGVRMTAGGLRLGAQSILKQTYGIRGWGRPVRLKVLRYPCGSGAANNPFDPIRPRAGTDVSRMINGIDDTRQVGYVDPISGAQDHVNGRLRLFGNSPPFRGTDQHNVDAQFNRQHRSNMPYYEGTVDFWIKWDLPPQGSDVNNQVVALGEIDPSSHNFSGLFGATAFGRFRDSAQYLDPASQNRNDQADFEGIQFFVYKEPGGWLRFTRLYFMEAFGANVTQGATGSTTANVVKFGSMRRIHGMSGWDGYLGTNDVCNDRGFGNNNLGFLYARTDAWLDFSQATYVSGGNTAVVLRPHDWHRFTLSYNSNTDQPFHLWLDGRKVQPVTFFGDQDVTNPGSFRNDGRHSPLTDGPVGDDTSQTGGADEIFVHRRSSKLIEINPEDRLTVGCIFRRQLDISSQSVYQTYFSGTDDQGEAVKPPRPVFKFDSNFVAVANATIDDFRISQQILPTNLTIQANGFAAFSRYTPQGSSVNCYYEHGFLPVIGDAGELYAQPVRLGTMSWIELRPDWDPYAVRGINMAKSSGIDMEWGVVDDVATMKNSMGGGEYDMRSASDRGGSGVRDGLTVGSDNYWASGGVSLRGAVLPSGARVGMLIYRAHFRPGTDLEVNNVTPFLLDVQVTVLTPPRRLTFVVEY